MEISFVKYSGTGNDFVVIDDRLKRFPEEDENLIKSLCNRHFGIGSDGLILIRNHPETDFEMVFFNPDGSRSLCGNGSRCAVHFAHQQGLAKGSGRFFTTDGVHEYRFLKDDVVAISMHDVNEILQVDNFLFVNTGSPHLIAEAKDLFSMEINTEGSVLRNHPEFKNKGGTNVNFVKRRADGSIDVRTFERGVEAETLSCGTGVTAVALAMGTEAHGQNEVVLHTKGGLLTVSYTKSEKGYTKIWLSGSVLKIFTGSSMLENARIKLRALETTDVDKLFVWENNPVNWRVSQNIAPYSRHVLIDYVNSVSDVFTDKQLRLMIEEKESGEAIGTVDLFDCDFKNKRTGIGILIAEPDKRRRGFASEVLEVILPYCFRTLSMHQVYCSVFTDNDESLKLFRKFGFEEVGVKADWTYHNGKFFDEVLMQKIREDEGK